MKNYKRVSVKPEKHRGMLKKYIGPKMMKFISTTPYRSLYLLQLPGAVLGGGPAEIEFCTFQTLKKPVKIL